MVEVNGYLIFKTQRHTVSILKNACEGMTFKEFEKVYGDKLKGYDLKLAHRDLGGKVRVSKKEEAQEDVA